MDNILEELRELVKTRYPEADLTDGAVVNTALMLETLGQADLTDSQRSLCLRFCAEIAEKNRVRSIAMLGRVAQESPGGGFPNLVSTWLVLKLARFIR